MSANLGITDVLFVTNIVREGTSDVGLDDEKAYRKRKEDVVSRKRPDDADPRKSDHSVVARTTKTAPRRENTYRPLSVVKPTTATAAASSTTRTAAQEDDYYTVDKIRTVFVDSEFRDTYTYPSPSDFVMTFERGFANVVQIRLASLEFPNIMPTISDSNDTISWINAEDFDLDPPYPVYTATLTEGSYTLTNLQNEISTKMSAVPRHKGRRISATGRIPGNQYFVVTGDGNTDYVGFSNIITSAAPNNPIATNAGTTTVIVNQPNHGYVSGETIHVFGVIGYVGGINATLLNTSGAIQVLSEDMFSYQCSTAAVSSQIGGGSNVVTGKETPFQLLFGSYAANNPSSELGFPISENSASIIDDPDPISTITKDVQRTTIDPINSIVQFVCEKHGLREGDSIYVYNFNVTPNIYYDKTHNGVFQISSVISEDVFEVQCFVEHVTDVSQAFIGTRFFQMRFPNHGFNRITEINQAGTNKVQIITLFDHGLTTGSSVLVSGTNSVPSVDGAYYNITVPTSDSFIVESAATTIVSPGYDGILSSDYDFYLYNVSEFGGFTSSDLNNKKFTVKEIVDKDTFVFQGSYGFSNVSESGGGDAIRINSKLHGWNGTQSNNVDGKLFRPIRLSGDDYCYMCIPDLCEITDSIYNNGPVKNIFAKLMLVANPGMILFDSYYSPPIELTNGVISTLPSLRFQIKSKNDEILNFNGFNYSFTLEITERFLKNKNLQVDINRNGILGVGRQFP